MLSLRSRYAGAELRFMVATSERRAAFRLYFLLSPRRRRLSAAEAVKIDIFAYGLGYAGASGAWAV